MSSTYKLLCLNHDPAIVIPGPDWNTPEPAIAAALEPAMHDWLVEDHGQCDLLVGRYSYPLVEVCCPAHRKKCSTWHQGPVWIDADWLRLLRAGMALVEDDAQMKAAVGRVQSHHACWTPARIHRLRTELPEVG